MAGTSNVYDDDQTRPVKEGDLAPPPPRPASKLAAEASLRKSSLIWSILRFPFVYGDDDGTWR